MQEIKAIARLNPRPVDAHKGDFGRVCIIGGCLGMTGAAALAGRSALRAGAGLVRVAAAKSALPIIAAIEPCFTTIALPEDSAGKISASALGAILRAAEENDIVAFGPGIGVSSDLKLILQNLIELKNLRLLADADGLNNLAAVKNWPDTLNANLTITPHPGEMKRLWKALFREPLPADRVKQAESLAQRTNALVVLKGAGTIVTDGKKFFVNKTGNPGMATAGSGDCLTGIIAALAGQGLTDFDAAVLGVYIHGLAGDIAAEKKGQISLIATDLIEALPRAFEIEKGGK